MQDVIQAAGGVVWRDNSGSIEVVLCSRHQKGSIDLFVLPKGHVEHGERIEDAAVREVKEETGLAVRIESEVLPNIRYNVRSRENSRSSPKVVYFYLMTEIGGNFLNHDEEFDEVGWFPIAEAEKLLTYDNHREVLAAVIEILSRNVQIM
jgi:ADP-ribose pyrophosphatase YjhB (NUDIX family)|tara:strand:- start:176 stop:625 length:450 start_codon:yes stop_codon:yes gene_type:complete